MLLYKALLRKIGLVVKLMFDNYYDLHVDRFYTLKELLVYYLYRGAYLKSQVTSLINEKFMNQETLITFKKPRLEKQGALYENTIKVIYFLLLHDLECVDAPIFIFNRNQV